MDSPFIYNKFVSGSNFIPRTTEIEVLTNRICKKEHTLIYEPPKSGKQSLVCHAFDKLRHESYNFKLCTINLFNVRTEAELLRNIRCSLVSCFAKTEEEVIKLQEDLMIDQIHEMTEYRDLVLNLSEALCSKFDTNVVMYFKEFQELLNFDTYDDTIALLERVWLSHTQTTYLITGSCVNAMKEIFVNHKNFYRFAERLKLQPIEERYFSEFIIRNFLKAGRVISRELATRLYDLTEGQPWYTQQLAYLAFERTKGFMTDQILSESFDELIETHHYLFQQITNRLSLYQLNFLRAILDGVTKFSTQEVLNSYQFNSSANVVRLKEALQRKEILEQDSDKWIFLDPLFKTWLKEIYWSE